MSDLHQTKGENETENDRKNDEENAVQSFTEAVREKYCFDGSDYTFGSCQITFHGKARTGGAKAELAHLRNVVLCNSNLTNAGIPREGLASLCPNVIDLDISGNNLTSWREILPIFQQLTHLKFVNLGGNPIQADQEYLEAIEKPISNVENLVLNGTFISWKEVLKFVKRLPALKEIHVCYNDYEEFSGIEKDDLKNIECFRANNNNIQKWSEVWKLRHLPKLHSLILSGNPVKDIFFTHNCCTGDHGDCQEPRDDCGSINTSQNCDKPVMESTDQNSSRLSASFCDTPENLNDQSLKEQPPKILKEQPPKNLKDSSESSKKQPLTNLKEQPPENLKDSSETLKTQPFENLKEPPPENLKDSSETSKTQRPEIFNKSSKSSKKSSETSQGKSSENESTDQYEASNSRELEDEFQAMVTELMQVANKMADQKSPSMKKTNRSRYDSLQSEDGDYEDSPKTKGTTSKSLNQMTKSWQQMAKSWGQMEKSWGQMSINESGKMSIEGQMEKSWEQMEQSWENMRKSWGQMSKDVVGKMSKDESGQMPTKTKRQMSKDGQMPSETLGQMQPDESGQITPTPTPETELMQPDTQGETSADDLRQMQPDTPAASKQMQPTVASEQTPSKASEKMQPTSEPIEPTPNQSEALKQVQPDTGGPNQSEALKQMQPDTGGQMQPETETMEQMQPDTPAPNQSEALTQMQPDTGGQMQPETMEQMQPEPASKQPTSRQTTTEEQTKDVDKEKDCTPFQNLHTLCLTETDIHHTDHLEALTKFPSLKSVRLRDVPLYKEHNDEVSWKLYLASLPNIELLNGSEISAMDRENSERFYLRHYLDFDEKPRRHEELEQKHGKLSKIVDIDLRGDYQEYATLQFYVNGKKSFKKRLCMRDSVDKLRAFVAKELKTSKRNFRLFHLPCGPHHVYENGEFPEEEKLVAYLPMSRFNMRDGDEIHVETATNIQEMDIRVVIAESRWQSRVPRD